MKNTSSRVAKVFTDVIVNERKPISVIITRTFLYLIQMQAVLYAVISATSCFGFVAPPLLKPHVVVSRKDGSWATGLPPVIPSARLSNAPGVSDI